jgi:SAM-dependent methyltransferase
MERLTLGKLDTLLEQTHLARYRFAEQFVKGKRVADIACGTGYGSYALAQAGAQSVHGMDISETAVTNCRKSYEAPNLSFSVGNAQNLSSIPDGAFDLLVSFETIEHLPDVDAYLREIARILCPGGTFLVSTPDRRISSVLYSFTGRPGNPFHVREYIEGEFLDLLSARFKIEACYGQAFVEKWLVFWPVQFAVKAICHLLRTGRALDFLESLYLDGGNVEVRLKENAAKVPKYWVISCTRSDS